MSNEYGIVEEEYIQHVFAFCLVSKEHEPAREEREILMVAFGQAKALGWGDSEADLKNIFKLIAERLEWPLPYEIAL